jgi:ATP-binding protein involved in chromosome partitioning
MDEAAIRAVLTDGAADRNAVLSESDISQIATEGDWVAVVLARDDLPRSRLAAIHRSLSGAFPGADVEIRAGSAVFRGGAGFGTGKHVIAVLGGKGGVGKSTVSVNLALTLTAMGLSVGLLDGDLSAPDLPHMLGVHVTERPRGPGWRLASPTVAPPSRRRTPLEAFGVELFSAGFMVPEGQAPLLTTRPMVSALLRACLFDMRWTADVLLIDAPPGTGQELQVMAQELPLSGALFVTTPQDLAQMDAERTLALLNDQGVPVIGLVQNMSSLTCPHCEKEIDLFAQSSRLSGAGVQVLGRVPFDVQLSVTADQGRPLVLGDPRGPVAYEFARIGSAVRRWLGSRVD